jgi:hypothetical protein
LAGLSAEGRRKTRLQILQFYFRTSNVAFPVKKEICYLWNKDYDMRTQAVYFNNIIEALYGLPLEDKLEIKELLEHNIADSRRNEIATNYKKSREEHKSGRLKFSSNLSELKEML